MKQLLTSQGVAVKAPGRLPSPHVVAAIGDIHGELDLFTALLDRIRNRVTALRLKTSNVKIVVLGDFIDKGINSMRVMNYLYIQQRYTNRLVVLRGNHEQSLIDCIDNPDLVPRWLAMGGWQTMMSFGVDPQPFADKPRLFADFARDRIGADKIAWLASLPYSFAAGDYFFCHAGVTPGVPLAEQEPDHLLWIRDQFLDSKADHGAVIVHGHAEEPRVAVRSNRIGLDTCAWRSGQLSSAVLTGDRIAIVTVDRSATQKSKDI